MDKKDSPIFVTGGTGFIGSYLLRYLLHSGYRHIRALRRASSSMILVADIADQIEWVEGDICDNEQMEDLLEGIDVVFHVAATVSFDARDKNMLKRVNVEGTASLVNAALEKGVKRFVHFSSNSVLGGNQKNNRLDESFKWDRSSMSSWYGITKFQAEMEVWRGLEEGLPAVIVNPSVVLGSGDWQGSGSSHIFHVVGKGMPFYPPGQTGFVDVRDVARFAIMLWEKDITGQRYLLNADNWTFRQLFTAISKTVGKKPPYIPMQRWMGALAWRFEWLRSKMSGSRPVITRETVSASNWTREYLNDKSRSLGFTYIPLSQTVEETARQWLESRGERAAVLPLV
jgi:dihydroflavonol-4-reductase